MNMTESTPATSSTVTVSYTVRPNFCSHCGRKIADGWIYCADCGRSVQGYTYVHIDTPVGATNWTTGLADQISQIQPQAESRTP
jgi:hypothetical protein